MRREVLLDILQEETRLIDSQNNRHHSTNNDNRVVLNDHDHDDTDDNDADVDVNNALNDRCLWQLQTRCVNEPECEVVVSLRRRSKKQGLFSIKTLICGCIIRFYFILLFLCFVSFKTILGC